MSNLTKIPTMNELVTETEMTLKENALMVILNQPPPEKWLVNHPMIQGYKYLPIERVEYLLTRIFGKWWVEIKNVQVIANSSVVTVRVYVRNPITGEIDWNDGVGAQPIQTDKGQGAMDWNFAKSDGVQKSVPSAETYAIKDACDKFGKIFGKDVSRKTNLDYSTLLKTKELPEFNEFHFEEAFTKKATLELIKLAYSITPEMEQKYLDYVGAKNK